MSHTRDTMQGYLEELLRELPEADVPAAQVQRVPGPAPVLLGQTGVRPTREEAWKDQQDQRALESLQKHKLQALLDQQNQIAEQPVDVSVAAIDHDIAFSEPELKPKDEEIKVPELLRWHENGRPLWAQKEFDVLLFEVSGLTLAVPLIALGQIQQIDDGLTPIFGQSDWFMGLLRGANGNIKTVNTALFVMPEKYNATFLDSARFVISIDGLSWGLAVDSVNQPSRIHPDEVKWRSNRTKRPWLAGTVKSAMCALIDIPQMGKLLLESEN